MPLPTITALPSAPSRSDAPATFNARADSFLGSFPGLVTELNAFIAAIPAAVNGIDYNGTSTTSVAIGTGSKSFTTQTGKNFQVGQFVVVAFTTTPANYMTGQVTSYNSGTGALVVNVTAVGGSGTQALWTISIAPTAGSYATITGTETLTNKTLTTPVIASISNSGTITLPTGTRTLVARDTTDTLTNKTIDTAGTNTIKVNGNTLAASAGTATLTFPNASDTLVGRATNDTLTNKTLTAPAINGATIDAATVVSDTGTIAVASCGFRGIPQNAKSAPYQLVLTDSGKHISITTGGITIPANASVAFVIGTAITIYNDSGSTQSIAITSDTLRWAGSSSTGARTLAVYGVAVLLKVSATTWIISGNVS